MRRKINELTLIMKNIFTLCLHTPSQRPDNFLSMLTLRAVDLCSSRLIIYIVCKSHIDYLLEIKFRFPIKFFFRRAPDIFTIILILILKISYHSSAHWLHTHHHRTMHML